MWDRFVRFIARDGRQLCGEPVDTTIDGGLCGNGNKLVQAKLLTNRKPVGLAVSEKRDVAVRVLSCASPLEDGIFTGETAVIHKVKIKYCSPLTAILTDIIQLLSPLSPDEVGTIRCIGLNFKDHAVSGNRTLALQPKNC